MTFLIIFPLACAILTLIWIWSGLVLSYLWLWFVTPLGVEPLSTPHAIGIVMLLSFLSSFKKPPKWKGFEFFEHTAVWFAGSLFTLGAGYIVKGYL